MVKGRNFSSENDPFDVYDEFEAGTSNPEYDPGAMDPLRKQTQDKFMGRDIDEKLAGGAANRGGSLTGGPVNNPTQYGRVGDMEGIAFEREQQKALGSMLADESAIEAALDAEIDALDKAKRFSDIPGEMRATGRIEQLQTELTKAYEATAAEQSTMGMSYEEEALQTRVRQASKGKITDAEVQRMTADVKPLPTTKKGKGPGIKNAQAIIDTGLSAKKLPTQRLKSGEYGKGGMKQVKVERELNKSKVPDKYKVDNTSYTSGSLEETVAASMGKKDPITGKPYKLYTGVTATGEIQPYKQPPVKSSKSPFPNGEAIPEAPNLPDARLKEQGYTAGVTERKGQVTTGQFKQGRKASGNKVSSVTPDAPKPVKMADPQVPADVRSYVSKMPKNMPEAKKLKQAQRLAKLDKIKGKGKGKGKLLTNVAALGIAAALRRDR